MAGNQEIITKTNNTDKKPTASTFGQQYGTVKQRIKEFEQKSEDKRADVSKNLVQKNEELRPKHEDEHASYKLQSYPFKMTGTKGNTMSQTETNDLTTRLPGTVTKDSTLEHSGGTQGLKRGSKFRSHAVYTDHNEDKEPLITDKKDFNINEIRIADIEELSDDNDGWSSSEFEDYESGPVPENPLTPTPSIGGAKQEKDRFITRSSSCGINSENFDPEGEEGLYLPPNINQTKHPPPELPKSPPHLSQIQVRKRSIIGDLIQSERSYIESLDWVIKEYKKSLLLTYGLEGTKVGLVMKKIVDIVRHHKHFQIELAETVKNWDEKEEIGSIFTASFPRSMIVDVYSVYINNFSEAMEKIKALQSTNPALKEFLKITEAKNPERLSLFGLMIKPIQRFPQFIIVIKDLLKYTPPNHHDRCNLKTALKDLQNVSYRLNEKKRKIEQNVKAALLLKSLKIGTIKDETPCLLRQDDVCQYEECVNGQAKTNPRRLYLLDKILIVVKVLQREQDNRAVERLITKMNVGDLELRECAIAPGIRSKFKCIDTELEHIGHDYKVCDEIQELLASLKCSYQGLSEVIVHNMCDLQKEIQVKHQQLQLLKSCCIILEDIRRNVKYTFQTSTPELKEEWCKDFLLAKLALSPMNNLSWHMSQNSSDEVDMVIQPSMFMKCLSVDRPRHFTKIVCAVPVFFSRALPSHIGIQHLWVVMRAEKMTEVALVSTRSFKPELVESFSATESEVVAVETVPGYTIKENTVWMATTDSKILVFDLHGRSQSTEARKPIFEFNSMGVAIVMRYTEDRMFVGLTNGRIVIYDRDYKDGKWNINSSVKELGFASVGSIIIMGENVWMSCGSSVYIIPMKESTFKEVINMKCDDNSDISDIVKSGVGLWVSYKNKSLLRLYHIETKAFLQEINVSSAVKRMMTKDSSTASSEKITKECVVTSLMASEGLLWVGTDFGIVMNYRLPTFSDGVPLTHGRVNVCYHSHNGPVKFLIPMYFVTVNTRSTAETLDLSATSREETSNYQKKNKKDKTKQDRRHRVNVEAVLTAERKEREFGKKNTPLDIFKSDSQTSLNADFGTNMKPNFKKDNSTSRYTTHNTIQRRNCNVVVVVSGGDGYRDWRSQPKVSPKHNDASLMFWMNKYDNKHDTET